MLLSHVGRPDERKHELGAHELLAIVEGPSGTQETAAYAERIVHGTVGFRLRVTRFEAKNKMSQNQPDEVVARVIEALRRPGPYRNPRLAEHMAAS